MILVVTGCATPAERARDNAFKCTLELVQNEANTRSAGEVCIRIYGTKRVNKNWNSGLK